MKKILKITSAGAVLLFLMVCSGCFGDDDFDNDIGDTVFSAGSLNLTTYVAIGDSLTAGFADGTVYKDGQINSFPNILAQSFAKVGGGTFTQPLANDNLGGLLLGGVPNLNFDVRLVLAADATTGALGPVRQNVLTPAAVPTTEAATSPIAGLYNNSGVPGAKSFHLISTSYGNAAGIAAKTANPFYVRFRSSSSASVVSDAAMQVPTFFTLWIGNNDILGYATEGGIGNDSSTSTAYGLDSADITDPVSVFAPTYSGIVSTLTSGALSDTKGALINIPAITSIPYFTAVPYNAFAADKLDQATIDSLNAGYAAYNAGLQLAVGGAIITQDEADRRTINFTFGQANAPVILDESLTDLTSVNADLLNYRQVKQDEDFILLPASSILGKARVGGPFDGRFIGLSAPMEDGEVLTKTEAAEVEAARAAYNATIKSVADSNPNLIYIDTATSLEQVRASNGGLNFGTGTITDEFATGGAFSLDGIHPTAKGYAVIANLIIDALNDAYGANIPKANPSTYPEVYFAFPAGYDFSQ